MMGAAMLITRGDDWSLLAKAPAASADSFAIDLEDGVAPGAKEAARQNARRALIENDYAGRPRIVRINRFDTEWAEQDLMIIEGRPEAIVLAKSRSAADVLQAEARIAEAEARFNVPVGSTSIIPMIEQAGAVLDAFAIARSTSRIAGLLFGPADLTVNTGAVGIVDGRLGFSHTVMQYCRQHLVLVAAAMEIDLAGPILNNFYDADSCEAEAREYFELGFTTAMVISPRGIAPVRKAYRPTKEAEDYARRMRAEFDEAAVANNLGVVAYESQMLEIPFATIADAALARVADEV